MFSENAEILIVHESFLSFVRGAMVAKAPLKEAEEFIKSLANL